MTKYTVNLPRGHIKTTKTYFQKIRKKFYKIRKYEFGLWDALWWPHVDIWLRYASIRCSLSPLFAKSNVRILDVGAGENIVSWFIDEPNVDIFTVDIDQLAIRKGKENANAVIASGTKLPFREDYFDAVLSIGTLEHVPEDERDQFLKEIKRVTRNKVIIYVPVNQEPRFRARWTDLTFQAQHKKIYRCEEKNTAEHIASGGWVDLSILKKHFPTAEFTPMHNCNVWLSHMINSQRSDPFIMLNGLYYLFILKKFDQLPPYFACKIVYDKYSSNR